MSSRCQCMACLISRLEMAVRYRPMIRWLILAVSLRLACVLHGSEQYALCPRLTYIRWHVPQFAHLRVVDGEGLARRDPQDREQHLMRSPRFDCGGTKAALQYSQGRDGSLNLALAHNREQ